MSPRKRVDIKEAKEWADKLKRLVARLWEAYKDEWIKKYGESPPSPDATPEEQTRWWQEKAALAGINGQTILDAGKIKAPRLEGNRYTVFLDDRLRDFEPIIRGALMRIRAQATGAAVQPNKPVKEYQDQRAAILKAIKERGKASKPQEVIRTAQVAEQIGRRILRELEQSDEYSGFTRARPKRYS